MKKVNEAIGIARCDIKKGEYCIEVNISTGKVTSKKIKFLPYGKQKVLRKIFYGTN